ncbi:MAG: hypothetical protein AAF614_13735 [Chloroflexota bacterium]
MRFITREQPYETPISAGQLRYEQDGEPTGGVEHWRLTAALEGYRVLHIDRDERFAPSGNSYLYHAFVNENGRFERLKFRFWGSGLQVTGNVLIEDDEIVMRREVNGESFDQTLAVSGNDVAFWFPSAVAMAWAVGNGEPHVRPTAVLLQANLSSDKPFTLEQLPITRTQDDPTTLKITGKERQVLPTTVSWTDKSETMWIDEHGAVLMIDGGKGRTAVATRYLRYTQ